ncbi:MAG: GNAT superfamily N-acetyltransferase [Phenylobacterium sp.]
MDHREIVRLFDAQVRANPVATPGLTVVSDGEVTRLEGAYNFVCHWTFNQQTAMQAIAQQADFFRQQGQTLMWRVYDYDQPANIGACLEQQGFVANPQGTLMVLPLEETTLAVTDHDIRHITAPDGLHDYLAVAEAAFDKDDIGSFDYFSQLLSLNDFGFFCGYAEGEPAVSGLLQIQPNSCFGMLFGGGVSPLHRGKGFYRATVAARVAMAKAQGLKYLTTEARQSSLPILESLGFIPLARETTWMLPID